MMERSKGPKRRAPFQPQNKGRKSSSRSRKVRASNQINEASQTNQIKEKQTEQGKTKSKQGNQSPRMKAMKQAESITWKLPFNENSGASKLVRTYHETSLCLMEGRIARYAARHRAFVTIVRPFSMLLRDGGKKRKDSLWLVDIYIYMLYDARTSN